MAPNDEIEFIPRANLLRICMSAEMLLRHRTAVGDDAERAAAAGKVSGRPGPRVDVRQRRKCAPGRINNLFAFDGSVQAAEGLRRKGTAMLDSDDKSKADRPTTTPLNAQSHLRVTWGEQTRRVLQRAVPGLLAASHAKGWLALLGGLVLAGGALWIFSPAPQVRYVTAPVTRGSLAQTVVATGTVNPVLTVIVGSYVSGVIQEVTCDFNTRVTKGQLCAKIDPRPYQVVVDQNRARLAVAKAQVAKDSAARDYAKLNYERNASLVKTNAVSRDVFDQSKAAADQAEAQLVLDAATIQQAEAELSAAEINLSYTNIVAPVNGTVVSRNVTMGQTVAASFQTPTLFLVATDLVEMQVDTNVSESDVGSLTEGAAAQFTVESFPDRQFTGKVAQVRQAPQNVQNVVTYDVVVSVKNDDLKLMPGMTATVKIIVAQHDGVLRVPGAALRYQPSAAGAPAPKKDTGKDRAAAALWVLRAGSPVRRDVKTGLDNDTMVEVMSADLKDGDAVIVSEQTGSGQAVRPHF